MEKKKMNFKVDSKLFALHKYETMCMHVSSSSKAFPLFYIVLGRKSVQYSFPYISFDIHNILHRRQGQY
jgi:hypothetical protein